MIGSRLYHRTIEWSEANLTAEGLALNHKVWDGTPWMVNAFTGPIVEDRMHEIISWCRERFGPEAWPIHGKPGNWHRGGATVQGWTWFGFATKEAMQQFEAEWGPFDG